MKNLFARGGIEFLAVLLGISGSLWMENNRQLNLENEQVYNTLNSLKQELVTLTEYSILSLTNIEFIRNYAGFFLPIVEWLYTWFWNAFLDWLFSLPIIIHQTLKAIFTTWLGFWILKRFR